MYKNFKGNHILVDYIGLYGDEKELGEFVFNLMIECINKTDMKIVHQNLFSGLEISIFQELSTLLRPQNIVYPLYINTKPWPLRSVARII